MQRSALCRSRRELSNKYLLAKFGFDTAENEPCKVCPLSAYRSPRSILEEQPSVPMENMIDCNEVTKLDDDFEAGLQNLVELPAVPPKDVSSSQSQCIVGQSTLLLGDFVVGASTNFLEHESLRSLKSMDEFSNQAIDIGKYPSSENILQKISAVSECDIESAEFPKRHRADSEELSPRGRGPTR